MKNSSEPAKTDSPDLELPDFTGIDNFTPRTSPLGALRLLEEYQRIYRRPDLLEEWKKRERIQVEFKF